MIASSHDEKIVMIENDTDIGEGTLLWDSKPLGPHVYVLQGPRRRQGHHIGPRSPTARPDRTGCTISPG
ncbi:MAG: hypothetical protein R3D59_01575 [Paracoccaceae bacterium]